MVRYLLAGLSALCLAAPAEATVTVVTGTSSTGQIFDCCASSPMLTAFTLTGAQPLSRITFGGWKGLTLGYADASGDFSFAGSLPLVDNYYGTFSGAIRSYVGTTIYDVTLSSWTVTGGSDFAAVPEPATWAMMLIGLGLIGLRYRRGPGQARGIGRELS